MSRYRTRSGTRSATTASTSCSTTAARARCGGRRRTSGSGSSMSPASSSRPLRRLRPASRSTTIAANTSSSRAADGKIRNRCASCRHEPAVGTHPPRAQITASRDRRLARAGASPAERLVSDTFRGLLSYSSRRPQPRSSARPSATRRNELPHLTHSSAASRATAQL